MSAKDITVTLITVDRSPAKNYLAETIENLRRGGMFASPRLRSFHVFDSNPQSGWIDEALAGLDVWYRAPTYNPRNATANAAAALRVGAQFDPAVNWVLSLEDDIDVCSDFLESAGAWLDDHAREDRRVYPLAAAYDAVPWGYAKGLTEWEYPVKGFYGTQAFAVRPTDAVTMAEFFDASNQASGWDILMHAWARKHYPEIAHFLTPVPSMVQHIGRESVIAPRPETHQFQGFAGRDYKYLAVGR